MPANAGIHLEVIEQKAGDRPVDSRFRGNDGPFLIARQRAIGDGKVRCCNFLTHRRPLQGIIFAGGFYRNLKVTFLRDRRDGARGFSFG